MGGLLKRSQVTPHRTRITSRLNLLRALLPSVMQQGSGTVRGLAQAHIPPEVRAHLLPTCQASSPFCTIRAGEGRPLMPITVPMHVATATPPPLSTLGESD